MGRLARTHLEELVMGLLTSGFNTLGFDGQNFFDAHHPVTDAAGNVSSVSNYQDGAEPA